MTTPMNCPNCNSQLPPGAPSCARCGMRFESEPEPASVIPPPPTAQPPATRQPIPHTPPRQPSAAGSSGGTKSMQAYLADFRERWGLEATPFFTAVIILAAAAVLLGSIAHSIYITASASDFNKHLDWGIWLTTADALALGALVMAVLVRRESMGRPAQGDVRSPDFRIGVGIVGLAVLWSLVAIFLGMGSHSEAAASWQRYATIFAFVGAGWFVLARPIPEMIGTLKAMTVGLIVVGVALACLLIGQLQGMGNSSDSYFGGVAWQSMAITLATIALGWFLGMEPKRRE